MVKTNIIHTNDIQEKNPIKNFATTGKKDNFSCPRKVKALNPSFFSRDGKDEETKRIEQLAFRTGHEGDLFHVIVDPTNRKPYIVHDEIVGGLPAHYKVRIPVLIDQHHREWILFASYHPFEAVNPWGETKGEWLKRGKKEWIETPTDNHTVIFPPYIRFPEPPAPSMEYEEYIWDYFSEGLITSIKHPVVKRWKKHIETTLCCDVGRMMFRKGKIEEALEQFQMALDVYTVLEFGEEALYDDLKRDIKEFLAENVSAESKSRVEKWLSSPETKFSKKE